MKRVGDKPVSPLTRLKGLIASPADVFPPHHSFGIHRYKDRGVVSHLYRSEKGERIREIPNMIPFLDKEVTAVAAADRSTIEDGRAADRVDIPYRSVGQYQVKTGPFFDQY